MSAATTDRPNPTAGAAYRVLVQALAAGEEVSALDVEEIITAAGATMADLDAAIAERIGAEDATDGHPPRGTKVGA